jgi:putative nucleotidyltransferase with HDIG domain
MQDQPDAKGGSTTVSNDRFSETAQANQALQRLLRGRDKLLESIPSIPAILQSLLRELEQPSEYVDVQRVADLISRDESLTAQCLRVANSPLFSRGQLTNSVHNAISAIGIARIRVIALTCTLMQIGKSATSLDPVVFWQHSLGTAILSRRLARSTGFGNPEQAYLAGLLHDIGYLVNFVLAPQQMRSILDQGSRERVFAGAIEHAALGFTHCQTGELLARKWHFSPEIIEVIRCHHNPAGATMNPALVAIVGLTDRLCRSLELGLGYAETPDPILEWEADWQILSRFCPLANQMTWADFVKDSDIYFEEIRELVKTIFSVAPA